jgi:hypothetical protein
MIMELRVSQNPRKLIAPGHFRLKQISMEDHQGRN